MNELQVIEYKGQRVLSTKQIAAGYDTTEEKIRWNFKYNRKKYQPGKHYILIEGNELRELKRECEFQTLFKGAKSVCLWTEKGALLHAKSINTDKAWEVYDYLVDYYFRAKENREPEVVQKLNTKLYVNVPDNNKIQMAMKKIKDDLTCMSVMLDRCNKYLNEEDYIQARKAAVGIVGLLIADCAEFENQKYEMVEKYY